VNAFSNLFNLMNSIAVAFDVTDFQSVVGYGAMAGVQNREVA